MTCDGGVRLLETGTKVVGQPHRCKGAVLAAPHHVASMLCPNRLHVPGCKGMVVDQLAAVPWGAHMNIRRTLPRHVVLCRPGAPTFICEPHATAASSFTTMPLQAGMCRRWGAAPEARPITH